MAARPVSRPGKKRISPASANLFQDDEIKLMKRRLSINLPAVVVFLCFAASMHPAPAAAKRQIERVRYSIDAQRTRLVLDVNAKCSYEVSTHKNPHRIAINMRGTHAGRSLKPVTIPRGIVTRVRVNKLSWGTQVVLDLKGRARFEHFTLAKSSGRPDRIVLDVLGGPSTSWATQTPAVRNEGGGKPIIVAVDAGHGGKDPGARGLYGLVEKRLVLDIAKRTAAKINEKKGYKAVLTRTSDVYLTLPGRTRIAERKGADIFVSVHLNSARKRSARGTEVFFVTPAGAAATASKVLSNPNRAAHDLGLDGSSNSDLLHMLVDVNQQAVLARSELLAGSILYALSRKDLPPTRSVKQRSFSVLRTITMPSVLVEAGFITNPSDAKIIRSESGRDRIAASIARGVVSFLSKHPPPRTDGEQVVVHKVKRGENLWKISRKYGTSVASLRKTNRLGKSSVLRVGQELLISNGY